MIYFEDMPVGSVTELGNYTVSEDEIIEFATKYDPQPFHVDPEVAKNTSFRGLAASGWHTAGIYMRLLVDGLINQTISMGSPGVDEIRWVKPVRPGDTLRARTTVVEARTSDSRPNMGIIRTFSEMFNQNDELVMTLKTIGMFGRRPADQ